MFYVFEFVMVVVGDVFMYYVRDFEFCVMFVFIVVVVVIIEGGCVLFICWLGGMYFVDFWEFFGGKVEEGELLFEVFVCELCEEIGVEIVVGDVVDVMFWCYLKCDVLLFFYCAECASGVGVVWDFGVVVHVWVRAEELDCYEMSFVDVLVFVKDCVFKV